MMFDLENLLEVLNALAKANPFQVIGGFMFAELLIGAIFGIIKKYISQFSSDTNYSKAFLAKEYTSKHFGNNFPRDSFDPFKLPPEIIIVSFVPDSGEVLKEEFITTLGCATDAQYRDGKMISYGSNSPSPLYVIVALIPCIIGFYGSFSSSISDISFLLLMSGFAWLFIIFFLPLIIRIIKTGTGDTESYW